MLKRCMMIKNKKVFINAQRKFGYVEDQKND